MKRDNGALLATGLMGLMVLAGKVSGSAALVDEGMVGEHWGSQGVGVLLTTGRRIFLMLRSDHVLDPGVWGVPGGAVRIDDRTGQAEDLYRAAVGELSEESGIRLGSLELEKRTVDATIFQAGSFRYTTFVVRVPEEFTRRRVTLNWESDDAQWMTKDEVEELLDDDMLHHGVEFTLSHSQEVFDGS